MSHDARALRLAASAPEKSRNGRVQRARRSAAELFAVVNHTMSHTPPEATIAGMLLEFAGEVLDEERELIRQGARIEARAEIDAILRELAAHREKLEGLLRKP